MTNPVLIAIDDRVAIITLNRPERKNAWTVPMQAHYFNALQRLADAPEVVAVVLTGAGGAFCPGADMEALTVYTETGTTNPLADEIPQPEWFPSLFPKPLIAAIEGPCAGVGLAQSLMCDIRIASPDARFSTAFARRGLPAMHGAEWLLNRVAGASIAHELLLTGRTFDGLEAQRLGVVNQVADDPLVIARDLASDLAEHCSPTSMAQLKSRLWTANERTLAQSVTESDAIIDEFLDSPDFAEGVASFLERRPPKFRGLP